MTMTGVDEEMGMGEYTVVATTAVNDNAVHSATSVTIASAGMTISEAWTMMEPSNTGGSLIQVTYMDESFLMQSAMSMANASADEEEDGNSTDDESSGEIDMGLPDASDVTAILGGFDDCIASNACEFPEGTTMHFPTLTSGMISMPVNNPEDGHSMYMTMQLGESGVIMTGFHMDMGDQSMGLEMLSSDEVSSLLTIDVSLESEALPFSLSEYWVQPGSDDGEGSDDVFVCDNGNEIPMDWVNDGMDDCGDNSDEVVDDDNWDDSDDSSNTLWWIVGSDGQFDFAGYLAEYSIVLASCSEEGDDSGTLNCGDDLMTVGLVDAMADGENAVLDPNNFTGIGFADEDDSGTLTDGDIIMVGGNTSVDWTHVRLHSSTAQAYSDENPTLPGFTTVLGVLSLMGAALINRRD
jgi:hypothetical protein